MTRVLETLASLSLVTALSVGALVAGPDATASASTLGGVATIASPGTSISLAGGGSETPFTVSLPSGAACDGDTSSDGYHVFSYLVPEGTNLSTVTFGEGGPSLGYGIVDQNGIYYGTVNTAVGTGQIVQIPNDFEWAPLQSQDALLPELLAAPGGVWETGLACANASGTLTDNWNSQVTFTASSKDPNGFVWTDVPGSSGNTPPAVTSPDAASFPVGVNSSFTVTATGNPAPTLSESGTLPTGVTFDAATGVLSGTPTAAASYPLTFTATNGIGSPAVQSFTLSVGGPPIFTSATSATFVAGSPGNFTVTTSGSPAPTLSESGTLPPGVSFEGSTGVLSGTTGATGAYPLVFTANNGVGSPTTQDFTLTVGAAPAITSAQAATFAEGSLGTFTISATGFPAPKYAETGTLPTGITLNATTGVLSGTPTQSGVYALTVTASNGIAPDATQNFTLTVDLAPTITSAAATSFTEDAPSSFTVTASGYPAPTFSESGPLPAGVSLDTTTGVLSGTPTEGGAFPLTLKASNGVSPAATQAFTLTVGAGPIFTSVTGATFTEGTDGSFTVTASGTPAPTFAVTSGNLPGGVSLQADGVLSGTPTADGEFPVVFTAHNGSGPDATQHFTLDVHGPPAITSASSTTFTKDAAGTFTFTASGNPASTFSVTGTLPTGVSLDGTTGVLSGTPTQGGSFPVTLTASNGVAPDATQAFTLVVGDGPIFTSAATATFKVGPLGSFTVTASGSPSPTFSLTSGTLPAGVTLDGTTGVLAGYPAQSGSFGVVLTAHNGSGPDATQDFTLDVDGPPSIVSAPTTTFSAGAAGQFSVVASGYPAPTFSEVGPLPAGVSFSAAGIFSGSPTQGGSFPVNVTAHNNVAPDAVQNFTLLVNAGPAVTSSDLATFAVGNTDTFTFTASGYPAATWTESGALPPGVTLDPSSGDLTGTPTAGGTYGLTVTAANGIGSPATQSFTLDVVPSALNITTTSLPVATVGYPYDQTLVATGGLAPYAWAVTAGPLPDGLVLDPATGVLSGIPTAATVDPISVTATDSAVPAEVVSAALLLTVNAAPTFPTALHAPVVGAAATASVAGYWLVDRAGDVAPRGLALTYGSLAGVTLNAPVVGMAATPDGLGYWLVTADGGIFSFGDAAFFGSTGALHLNAPIVGLAATPDGGGYWLVASDGGIFSFGDAAFFGSTGALHLNAPIVGMTASPDGGGYRLVASDGGIFSFGDARFFGSTGALHLNARIVGMATTPDGQGYWLAAADGGIFSFGDATFKGSEGATPLVAPITGISSVSAGGYRLVAGDGGIFSFGDAPFYAGS